jgi:PAS domain S-box-containing protein
MKGKDSKEQLMEELNHLRKRVAELESADAKRKQAEEEVHSKEQLFRALIDHSSDIIVLVNREGTIIYENPAIEQAIGLKPEERLGASVFERIHLDDVKIVTDAFSKLWQDPDTAAQKAEIRLRHKDGKWRTFEATGTNLVRDSAIEAVIVNLRDITNRKQVEQKLRASEERFRALIESSLDVVTIVDAKGTVLFQSPNYTSLWGRDPSGEVGKDMFKDVHPDDIPLVGDAFVRLLKNPKEPVQLQVRALHTDGTWRNLDVVAHNHLENPAVRGIVVTFRDITERKRAEEEFKENEARLRAFIDNAPDLIVIYDLDGNVVDGNRKGGELTGYRRSEIVGKNFIESGMVPEEYIRKAQKGLEKNRKGEPAGPDEYELIARDGRRIPVEITSFPVARAGKVEVIGIARDITERKKAEEDLRKSEENFRRSLDDSPLGIRIVTVDGETLYANQAMLDIYGYDSIEELKTTSPKERYTPESYAEHQVRKEKRQRGEYVPSNYEISIMRKNGEIRHLEVFRKEVLWNGETQFQVLYNDITERKKAEVELERAYKELKSTNEYMVQSTKIRALGEMASGVAHDFNNVLAVILGRAQLALEDVRDNKIKKDLQLIEQTALDAAKTVKRLQEFSRVRADRAFETLSINQVIQGALQMVESRRIELEQTKGIAIKVEEKLEEVAPVAGEAAELREALINILFNAMDAMPNGGKITITAKNEQKGSWVVLSVKDTGIGIPDRIKDRMFEPFFTTKTLKGSGLGLSMTYGIVTRYGGIIEFDSEVGKGTTFHIKLPAAAEAIENVQENGTSGAAAKRVTILLVDDDPEIIEVLGLTLEHLGHRVRGITNGREAIEAFKKGNYDLVITDLGMPDVSGWDIARAVKEIKPDVPVLLITGWGMQIKKEQLVGVDGVISKPFGRDVLSAKIAEVFSPRKRTKKEQKRQA